MRRTKSKKSAPATPAPPLPESGAVIGYARVSTDEQSLDMQVSALNKFGCQRILFETISGARKDRPELNKAILLLRPGDTFVIWKLDRLGRTVVDILNKVQHITEEIGARLVILTQNIDTTTSMGRAMIQLLGVFAELERELTRERTRAGMQRRREKGLRMGREPVLSPEKVERAQKMRDDGESIATIAAELGCSPGTIRKWTVAPELPR